MEKIFRNRRFFNILLLIFLVGFLVLPKICLADNLDDINSEELSKYLGLPEKDANKLMDTLRQVFTTEGISLWGSGYSTEEEISVAITLLKVTNMQALSHLLVDAPLEITQKIINAALNLVQIYINPAVFWEKFEKLTVEKAIEEGKKQLFQNEIKVTPGAIKFKYDSYKGEEKEIILQYVMIYKPVRNGKKADVVIRFYMPNSIEAPAAEKYKGIMPLCVPDLRRDFPPFIVEIKGIVKKDEFDNYLWINEIGETSHPSVNITFPLEVPDLGIKLLTPLEKYLLKPIETTIKEVEVIITKVKGESLGLTDIWNGIKSFISKIKIFSAAGLVETQTNELVGAKQGGLENISNILNLQTEKLSPDNLIEVEPQSDETEIKQEQKPEQKLTLEEIQEILDDISEKIDIISQEIVVLTVSSQPVSKENQKAVKKEEISEEETEEETILTNAENSEINQKLCPIISGIISLRNKVIFNEIAWMGGVNSANDEWIELRNISGTSIDLTGWQILDKNNQIKIIFPKGAKLLFSEILILERTNDNSVPGVTADLIYSGILNNTDEALYLFDRNCQLRDEVLANPNWPAGDKDSKRTMERKYDSSWQTSLNYGGTPKAENSLGYIVNIVSGGGGGGEGNVSNPPVQQEQQAYSTTTKILVTEVQIASASNANDEFIELYNPNDQEVDLTNWSIQKSHSTSTTIYKKNFEVGNKIPAKGYFLIVYTSSTDNNLLNLADITHKTFSLVSDNTIYLVVNQEKIENASDADVIDMVGFGQNIFSEGNPTTNPPVGKTIGRKWSTTTQSYIDTDNNQNDFELQTPTPKAQNQNPEPEPPSVPELPLLTIVINEIAWMGTVTSSNDEWIEFYNNTDEDIDLTDWTLKAADGTPLIDFPTSTVSAQSYFLSERTDDTTISDVSADLIYTGALENSGEKLELRNASGTLIDMVDCFTGWFAGTTTSRHVSMERINPKDFSNVQNWANNNQITKNGLDAEGNPIYGTPKAENSVSKSQTEISGMVDYPHLTLLGSPYVVTNTLTIPQDETLTIEPDVNLKFNDNAGLEVNGTLKAIGEENKKIIFTSFSDSKRWKYIYFSSSSADSVLENCLIKNLSCAENNWAISVVSTSIIIKNSKIENTATNVLQLRDSSSTVDNLTIEKNSTGAAMEILGGAPEIKNSKFIDTYAGMFIKEGSLATITKNYFEGVSYPSGAIVINNSYPYLEDNSGVLNSLNGIYLYGEVSNDWKLYKNENFPYYFYLTKISEDAVLEFEPGVIVNNSKILEIDGTLKAEGTDTDKVTISGCSFDGCYEGQLYFTPQSKNSAFKNVLIKKGHSDGAIKISGTDVDFQNTEFRDNNIGLLLENSSSVVLNCVFSDNSAISIEINDGAPSIRDSNFSNGNVAVLIEGGEAIIENNHFENFFYPTGTIFGKDTNSTFSGNSGQNNQSNKISLWDTINNIWTYIDL